jgi:hypothetical protein
LECEIALKYQHKIATNLGLWSSQISILKKPPLQLSYFAERMSALLDILTESFADLFIGFVEEQAALDHGHCAQIMHSQWIPTYAVETF